MTANKVILFNPRSAKWKHRIPNSILQVGASIYGKFDFVFVDGNLEEDPWSTIEKYLKTGEYNCFGVTVMPGPQLKEAIPFSREVKKKFPDVAVVWGGYFAANQHRVALESSYVDVVINGPGDLAFPSLLEVLGDESKYSEIDNIIYIGEFGITKTKKEKLIQQDKLPQLPYSFLNEFYPLDDYLARTFLGERTLAYHSSIGCPFTCSFCAVVPIYNAKWQGKSAENMYKDVKWLKENYGLDSIEFHDNNFFTSRKRVVEFSKLILNDNISWWGEGRIDTVDKYSDEELQLMSDAGCKMIFFGAESGSDEILKQMDKGGSQTAAQIKSFAKRLRNFGIIPEYSFVLGMPADTEELVYKQVNSDIKFIKEIKEINPDTEIIIYLYSPVPTEGSELYERITKAGFQFPNHLDDWLSPVWENFDLRKNPITPWLTPKIVDRIMNFEVVLNGRHPTTTDIRIKGFKKGLMRSVSSLRYKTGIYKYPYEIKAMHKFWKYRQPEIEGFYSE
ncbi:MAG: anaerobic magnesium-protoporphyrin IX monomethyl ester cyclase [Parvicella sp.]